MKILFKWLLFIGLFLAGVYAAAPLWLPYLLERQLPSGFELVALDIDHPTLSGLHITSMQLRGQLLASEIHVIARQLDFEYQGGNTVINSLELDIDLPADTDSAEPFSLDTLSLPLLQVPPGLELSEIRVNQLQLSLHTVAALDAGNPLLINFDALVFKPSQDGYRLITGLKLTDYADTKGLLEVELSEYLFRADVYFSVADSVDPWLTVGLEQIIQQSLSRSEITLKFDAPDTDQKWLDGLVKQVSAGWLHHLEGGGALQAEFSGDGQQKINQLNLFAKDLQLVTEHETLSLDAELLGLNQAGIITITQGKMADLHYRSRTDEGLLSFILAGLQHPGDPSGEIDIRMNNMQFEFETASMLETLKASGLVEMYWQEQTAFIYDSANMLLQADKLDMSVVGAFSLDQQKFTFKHFGDMDIQLDTLQLALLSAENQIKLSAETSHSVGRLDFEVFLGVADMSPAIDFEGTLNFAVAEIEFFEGAVRQAVISAETLPLSVELSAHTGQLISHGKASLETANITLLDSAFESASAGTLDLYWEALDLFNLTGELNLKTSGFVLKVGGAYWQGFDLDLNNQLRPHGKVEGSGKLLVSTSPTVPVEYQGNLKSGNWQLKVPSASVEVARLQALMAIAHIQVPEMLKLNDGSIDVSAEISAADETSIQAVLKGGGVGLSMFENNIGGGDFEINVSLGDTFQLMGPVVVEYLDIAGGIAIREIHADVIIEGADAFQADNLEAKLLGGKLLPTSLYYKQGSIDNSVLQFNDMDRGCKLNCVTAIG